ncbi:MAG: hypothetical protein JST00_36445 [Deltaproteobacteria bacterium]|nr:hypothetical protein [Deltaproteobacteria bacterium]
MIARTGAALVFSSLILLACSSGSGTVSSSSGGGGGDALSACSAYRAAHDDRSARCRGGSPEAPQFDAFCARLLAAPGSGFSAALFSTCAQKLGALPCDQAERDAPECDFSSVVGTLPDGAACGGDYQCASGECKGGDVEDDDLDCGTCAPRGGVGAACGSGQPSCARGLSCTFSGTDTNVGKCQALGAAGAACDNTGSSSCGSSLECDNATKKCVPYPKAGAPCTGICAGSLRCIGGTCQLGLEAGGSCPTGGECGSGFTCNSTTKKCEVLARVPVGGACGTATSGSCERTADCHNGVCAARLAAGSPCTTNGVECERYHVCLNGTCTPVDPAVCK